MDSSAFYTRKSANDGVKLPLELPDGTPTDEWLIILGVDSDAFREAETAELRRAIEADYSSDEERDRAANESKRRLAAALIGGWSFDEEKTPETAFKFLTEAPHIQRQVDMLAIQRKRFFKKGPQS